MMSIVYVLLLIFSRGLSLLPERLLYILSDAVCVLVYDVFGIRKKVVNENLRLAFPDWTEAAILKTQRKVYHHLCDVFLETLRYTSLQQAKKKQLFQIQNLEALDAYKDRNLIVVCGHYANWEYGRFFFATKRVSTHAIHSVYSKISNSGMDRFFREARCLGGIRMIERNQVTRTLFTHHKNRQGVPQLYLFINDQAAPPTPTAYWQSFMGVSVPVFTGFEEIAKKFDYPIFFLDIQKSRRGRYTAQFILMTDQPRLAKEYTITDAFIRHIERQIYQQPAHYFWTHKRWKHRYHKEKQNG